MDHGRMQPEQLDLNKPDFSVFQSQEPLMSAVLSHGQELTRVKSQDQTSSNGYTVLQSPSPIPGKSPKYEDGVNLSGSQPEYDPVVSSSYESVSSPNGSSDSGENSGYDKDHEMHEGSDPLSAPLLHNSAEPPSIALDSPLPIEYDGECNVGAPDPLVSLPTVPPVPSPRDAKKIFVSRSGCLLMLPEQRQRIVYRKGVSFTLMVAGESGSGKSTFLRMLLGDLTQSNAPVSTQVSSHGPLGYGIDKQQAANVHRTTQIEINRCVVSENGFEARFTLVDTPGFGDYTNNQYSWTPITNFIDTQYQRYMCAEEQPSRSKLVDTRVHVCLYFLQPSGHSLMPLDIISMKEIGARANLVPIISKSDSQTVEELASFKKLVRDSLQQNEINVFDAESQNWPYALVSSTEMVRAVDGREVCGRQYDWGTVEVDNPLHSDLLKLKQLLMSHGMLDLIDQTHERHYKAKRRELRLFRLGKALNNDSTPGPHSILKSPHTPAHINSALQENDVERYASRMTGLEILTAISPFGQKFLDAHNTEENVLFKENIRGIKNQFNMVLQFQRLRFDEENAKLIDKRKQFQAEVDKLENSNRQLEQHIAELMVTKRKK